MKDLSIALVLALSAAIGSAQTTFERYYPFAGSLETQGGIVDAEGHLVVTATVEDDLMVMRLLPTGEVEWSQRYPIFTEEGLYGPALASTSEGIFLAGYTMGFGTASRDGVLLHIGFDGTLIGTKRLDVLGGSNAFHGVTPLGHGFLVAGRCQPGANSYDMFLGSFDSSGDLEWTSSYGSSQWDWAYQAILLADGGHAMVGYGDGLAPQTSAYVVRTDADGTELWARGIYSTGADEGYTVAEDAQGNLYIGGRSLGMGVTPPSVSGFITKLDPNGTHLWTKVLPNAIEITSLKANPAGGVTWLARPQNVTGGFGGYDIGWGVLDADGQAVVTKIYGRQADDYIGNMAPATGGGWYLFGTTNSFQGEWAFQVIKIDADGEGSCNGSDWDIAWQSYTPNVVPFNSVVGTGAEVFTLELGTTPLTIFEQNPCCEVLAAFTQQQTPGNPYQWTFTNTSTAGATYSWDFGDGTTSTETSPVHTFTGNGSYFVCLTVTGDCGDSETCAPVVLTVGVDELGYMLRAPYPNPADQTIRIDLKEGTTVLSATAIDAQGRRVQRMFYGPDTNGVSVSVDDIASGSYLIELELGTGDRIRIPVMVIHQ
jgi:hypothetical protein